MSEAGVDTIVAGAGVIGLACAAAIARSGRDVLVLEASGRIGAGLSGRNSEVIHSGLYYETGSLKHRLSVHGRRRLYPYLEKYGVEHARLGKLIVATSAEDVALLERLHARAEINRVEGVSLLSGAEATALEPNLAAQAALHCRETGILDSGAYMRALSGEIEVSGGAIALRAPVTRVTSDAGGYVVETGGAAPTRVRCRAFVNACGPYAHALAGVMDAYPLATLPPLRFAKGSYFACAGAAAFQRLIYPAPVDGGLGVHLTLDLGGRMRFGPDVEWLNANDPDAIDLRVDGARATAFANAVRRYWPGLREDALTPDFASFRPKLSGPGEPPADFRIDGPDVHGLQNLVALYGIESPGLTASLAIAEDVLARLESVAPRRVLSPAVFFDRDGTLNEDIGYAHREEDLRWIDGAIDAVRMVNARGWRAIVVTNQAGIARGFYDEVQMHRFHARMQSDLASAGARIDAFYHAPHHADAIDPRWRHPDHPDRKPNPGMILRALRDWPIDPLRALMIGDKDLDLEAARAAGIAGALFTDGNLRATLEAALAREGFL